MDFKHPKSAEFYRYWLDLPRVGFAPSRDSFRPEQIPSLLPNFMIYEMISDDYIKIRLLGSNLSDRFGDAREGTNYLDLVGHERKVQASQALWSVVNQPCGLVGVVEQVMKSGLSVCLETVGLPLLNKDGGNPLILFQKNELDCEKRLPDTERENRDYLRIFSRRFIDIGAGLDGVQDLVYPSLAEA
ncbi:PAS domain-containing protein [uncultured Kiloniella sp.]|uniref:PAS domain-containing protein n=1 Tax=uncultured Kiloniella sp. TaxID=1133091 RepID=UPI00261B31EA|nr:PAS domain-containing protein [uncultured Kiloniella sp.]